MKINESNQWALIPSLTYECSYDMSGYTEILYFYGRGFYSETKNNEFFSPMKYPDKINLIEGPFSMIPTWATHIQFTQTGSGWFLNQNNDQILKFPAWDNCPDSLKNRILNLG